MNGDVDAASLDNLSEKSYDPAILAAPWEE